MTDAMRRIHVAGCVSCPFMAQLDGEDGDHQDMGGNPCGDYCRFDIREPRLINDGARVNARPEWCPLNAGGVIIAASGECVGCPGRIAAPCCSPYLSPY